MPSPPVAPLRRRRLVDDATQTLRDAILDGRFTAGARLRQTDLADQLAISRTPVREALGRLQHEGLVELLPGGGVRVAVLADAATGKQLDQAFVLEPAQRLADRSPADGELVGEVGLPQPSAGREAAVKDGVAERLGGVVHQAPPPERGHGRAGHVAWILYPESRPRQVTVRSSSTPPGRSSCRRTATSSVP